MFTGIDAAAILGGCTGADEGVVATVGAGWASGADTGAGVGLGVDWAAGVMETVADGTLDVVGVGTGMVAGGGAVAGAYIGLLVTTVVCEADGAGTGGVGVKVGGFAVVC